MDQQAINQPQDAKFSEEDVLTLRMELQQSGLDTWQAAELISSFLAARGYGVSSGEARQAATSIDASRCNVEHMHRELERLALVM